MANNPAGIKTGAASHPQILSLEVVLFKGGRSVAVDGKSILLQTDIGPRETLTWKLAAGTPAAADKWLVTVVEDEKNGWIEVTNGLTGVRIPNGKTFTDE